MIECPCGNTSEKKDRSWDSPMPVMTITEYNNDKKYWRKEFKKGFLKHEGRKATKKDMDPDGDGEYYVEGHYSWFYCPSDLRFVGLTSDEWRINGFCPNCGGFTEGERRQASQRSSRSVRMAKMNRRKAIIKAMSYEDERYILKMNGQTRDLRYYTHEECYDHHKKWLVNIVNEYISTMWNKHHCEQQEGGSWRFKDDAGKLKIKSTEAIEFLKKAPTQEWALHLRLV